MSQVRKENPSTSNTNIPKLTLFSSESLSGLVMRFVVPFDENLYSCQSLNDFAIQFLLIITHLYRQQRMCAGQRDSITGTSSVSTILVLISSESHSRQCIFKISRTNTITGLCAGNCALLMSLAIVNQHSTQLALIKFVFLQIIQRAQIKQNKVFLAQNFQMKLFD